MGGDIWRPQLRAKCQKIDSKNDVGLRHSRPILWNYRRRWSLLAIIGQTVLS